MNPIIYHCPSCRAEVTIHNLVLSRASERNKRIGHTTWDTYEIASYSGFCPDCGIPLTIDQYGINHQFEKI